MRYTLLKNTVFLTLLGFISCINITKKEYIQGGIEDIDLTLNLELDTAVVTGSNRTASYLPMLQGKKVGIVTNASGLIFKSWPHTKAKSTHIVDSLLAHNIDIRKVFAPEHGFRGAADAGEIVHDEKDIKTGLPIISLHGKNKKPTQEQLEDIDLLLFDIQDVGVRFYTYIATLQYIMEAAAKKGIPVIVLDRPNPNGHYVDGPLMQPEHTIFLGLQPIPLVYGMTIGEYALMINKEGWLEDKAHSDLTVIPLEHWTHQTTYSLPVRPSPNLPNDKAINLYPSLGLFEGTTINAGRGTEMQFQVFGSPKLPADAYTFSYTPQPNFGAKYPKEQGNRCQGLDLRAVSKMETVDLSWLIDAYSAHQDKANFFKTKGFTLHAGTSKLQEQIEADVSFNIIKEGWKAVSYTHLTLPTTPYV